MGRIWRVVPDGAKAQTVRLPTESAKLVEFLGHANGVIRDTAQRLFVERKDAAIVPAVAKVATNGATTASATGSRPR